jgi:hypothetical protein
MRSAMTTAVVALAFLVLGPTAALAQSNCVAPPGASAIDQYCEVVPDGTGGSSTGRGRGSDAVPAGGASRPAIPRRAASRLSEAGPEGDRILSLAGASSQQSGTRGDRSERGSDAARPEHGDSEPFAAASENPLEAVVRAAEDQARVGSGFGWVLLLALAAMATWGWISFRRLGSRS